MTDQKTQNHAFARSRSNDGLERFFYGEMKMKKQIQIHAISLALGVLLAAAGWHFLTWQFWAWIFPLHGLLVLRDHAVRSNVI